MPFQISKKSIFLVILLLVFLSYFNKPVKNVTFVATSPVNSFFGRVGANIAEVGRYFTTARYFQIENKELKNKIKELEQKIASQQIIEKENTDLKNAIGLKIDERFNLVTAKSITKYSTEDVITINKGENDGVFPEMTVITPENILVGRVTGVFPSYSEVTLLTHTLTPIFNSKVPSKNIEALSKGGGNGLLTFEYAPTDRALEEGDVLVSSLTGGIFPEGFLIGYVKKYKKSDTDPTPYVEIEPAYEFKYSDSVFLISPK